MCALILALAAALSIGSGPVAKSSSQCRDRIEQVRAATGQPRLDRAPASAEQPLLIAAVDKRIDGCAVMQMKGNVNDLRPLPVPKRSVRLQPAG